MNTELKIWRNDHCPCWSKKKYKKCYGEDKISNNCSKYLSENVGSNIARIQSFIDEAVNEVAIAWSCLTRSCHEKTLRIQTIIAFALAETLSKLRWSFDEIKWWDKSVFISWFNKFLATEENPYRKDNKHIHMDWNILYKLRCTLTHWLAMPNIQQDGKAIMICTDPQHESSEAIRKHIKWSIVISATDLSILFIEWGKIMIDHINKIKWDVWFNRKIQNIANYLDKQSSVPITSN